jgi:Na+/H+ antiporter NhaD/arsenite permease-like protein
MMNILVATVFITGYLAIALEHKIRINKAASAILTGVVLWTLFVLFGSSRELVYGQILGHLGEISGILFFLLGAMTIVEIMDAHDSFEFITGRITTRNPRRLLWIIGFISFFLSSILDNLTTTIVMVSLVRKLIRSEKERWIFAGIIVISANAGGAWTPIGDVTTTMLWIGRQVTTVNIMVKLLLPSLVCMMVPLALAGFMFREKRPDPEAGQKIKTSTTPLWERRLVFFSGLAALLFVPVFKTLTGLPPFLGMLLSLGCIWVLTERLHRRKNEDARGYLSVAQALRRTDTPTILFFLGILLSVAALRSCGLLGQWAAFLTQHITSQSAVVLLIGLISAVIDNVPLVAAVQGMYPLTVIPTDDFFWEFLAYTTGTGGSILIIGSAAGVAAMGMERIPFFWYVKRVSLLALAGYFSGALIYLFEFKLLF